ncbi:SPOR domain-containing protein [Ramlibacter albus]|uniref:SPOR domain-containing protein n=1 Tax=Ramlibacter albus TaxID=2079448 RepID=A0A923M6L3_9BURK|nr:SPOR domain-containing protein [Ramlibacter albus]MBC5763664.1 SPOR domain-containing protein [Ramlibacter albus]
MLRLLVLALLLANGAYFAWSQGYMLPWGFGPAQQSEPQRMAQQLRPEALRVLRADEARRAEAAAAGTPRPPECLQAGTLEETQSTALSSLLEGWPTGSWMLETSAEPARWIVYMGKYASDELVARKKGELRQLGISFEPLSNTTLEPGLSLGGFTSQADANRHLENLAQRGVRTARVVQERGETKGLRLVLPAVDDALRPRLEELKPILGGKTLRPCRGM